MHEGQKRGMHHHPLYIGNFRTVFRRCRYSRPKVTKLFLKVYFGCLPPAKGNFAPANQKMKNHGTKSGGPAGRPPAPKIALKARCQKTA